MKKLTLFLIFNVWLLNTLNAQILPDSVQNYLDKAYDLLGGIKKIKKENEEAILALPNDGISGQFHEQNAGKFVFSKSAIDLTNPDPNKVQNKFKHGDYINVGFFLKKGLQNYPLYKDGQSYTITKLKAGNGQPFVPFYIKIEADGNPAPGLLLTLNKSTITSYSLAVFVSPDFINPNFDEYSLYASQVFLSTLNKLSPGMHKLKLSLYLGHPTGFTTTSEPLATGEIEYNKDNNKILENKVCLTTHFKPVMRNAILEANILESVRKWGEYQKANYTFNGDVKIFSHDWQVVYNSDGTLRGREIAAYVSIKRKENGACSGYLFNFLQHFNGTGYSSVFTCTGRLFNASGTDNTLRIHCGCEDYLKSELFINNSNSNTNVTSTEVKNNPNQPKSNVKLEIAKKPSDFKPLNKSTAGYYCDKDNDGKIVREGYKKKQTGGNAMLKNGETREYYDNGSIREIQFYLDGTPNGEYYHFSKEGIIDEMGHMKDGKKHGVWKYCNDKGEIIKTVQYKEGMFDSQVIHSEN